MSKAKIDDVLRGVKRINEMGQDFGVHPVTIGHLKKELQAQTKALFEGKREPAQIAAP
jgi:transposase